MIEQIRQELREALTATLNAAMFVSFGKDSLLLMNLARETNPDIPIFFFGDQLSAFASQTIMDNDLTIWNYAPADRYFIPSGDGLALIDEYSLRDVRFPVVTEIVEGDDCNHSIPTKRTPQFNYSHPLTLWGYRQGETCEAVGGVTFPKEIDLGVTRLFAPLFEFTDEQVFEALDILNVPYIPEPDTMQMCSDCLSAINAFDWDRELALTSFRNRFQFH